MNARFLIALLVASSLMGCAHMRVKKVSQAGACECDDDDVKGFRYQLSRPYVHVKRPVLVSETREFYLGREDGQELFDPVTMKTVTTYSRGKSVVQAVSESELQSIRDSVLAMAGASAADSGPGEQEKDDDIDPPNPRIAGSVIPGDDATSKQIGRGDIEILFLPDCDETYAVHGRNFVSRHSYGLNFQDGWMLTGVNARADSTAVPLEILNVVNRAIEAARNIGVASVNSGASLDSLVKALPGVQDKNLEAEGREATPRVVYQRVRRVTLKPGLYRINKPWECSEKPIAGAGLLANLGLPTVETVIDQRVMDGEELTSMLSNLKAGNLALGEGD